MTAFGRNNYNSIRFRKLPKTRLKSSFEIFLISVSMFAFNSAIDFGNGTWTLYPLNNPINKKSQGFRSGDLGGH